MWRAFHLFQFQNPDSGKQHRRRKYCNDTKAGVWMLPCQVGSFIPNLATRATEAITACEVGGRTEGVVQRE